MTEDATQAAQRIVADVVERLRRLQASCIDETGSLATLAKEAAEEIERLRRDVARHVEKATSLATENERQPAAYHAALEELIGNLADCLGLAKAVRIGLQRRDTAEHLRAQKACSTDPERLERLAKEAEG